MRVTIRETVTVMKERREGMCIVLLLFISVFFHPYLDSIYSCEATSQVAMLAWIFGDCREGQRPRSLLR